MNENVYEAPQSELVDDGTYEDNPIASTGQRFLNMIIDTFGYLLLAMVVGVVLTFTGGDEIIDKINDYAFGFLLMSFYFVPLEAIWGRSLGKLITRTKVVNLEGKPASFGQICGRTLIRFVPFDAFSFLGGNGHPQGWHDKWSNTKVVSLKKAK